MNILNNCGYVEIKDFTRANSSLEARVNAACEVAKVCRDTKVVHNPAKLYKRLNTEHAGAESEIVSFIPVYAPKYWFKSQRFIHEDWKGYGYSNLRNLLPEYHDQYQERNDGFLVFKIKVPYMIVDHLRRHKLLEFALAENWQSNRSFHEREYYHPSDSVDLTTWKKLLESGFDVENLRLTELRPELKNKGEFGFRMVTGYIGGWVQDPYAWKNFFAVRRQKPTQAETLELANAMWKLIPEKLKIILDK